MAGVPQYCTHCAADTSSAVGTPRRSVGGSKVAGIFSYNSISKQFSAAYPTGTVILKLEFGNRTSVAFATITDVSRWSVGEQRTVVRKIDPREKIIRRRAGILIFVQIDIDSYKRWPKTQICLVQLSRGSDRAKPQKKMCTPTIQ